MWSRDWEGLTFQVEHRAEDGGGGPTLRVSQSGSGSGPGRERLRFDCFLRNPHFHLDGEGADEVIALSPLDDNVEWVCGELRRDLTGYLKKAGLEHPAANDPAALTALGAVLTDAETAMRNPPARLDDVDLATLKARVSEKWNTYPKDIFAAWVAEMDFPLAEPVRLVLQRALDRGDIGYPVDSDKTGLPEAFAEHMESRFGWQIDPHRIEILADVVQGMYVALGGYTKAGEGAVVQTPIYPPFLSAVDKSGRRLVEHRVELGENGFAFDLDALRAVADPSTRLLLFCNPHNPTGRVFRRDELEGLADLALERDWVVVSDEIHADLVFSGHRHIPFGSLAPEVAARTLTLNSATKSHNIPGLRTCVAHFGSAELQQRFNAYVPERVRGGMGLLGFEATIAAWRHGQPWLDEVLVYLEENRDFVRDYAAANWPDVVAHIPESTYLMWLDFAKAELPTTPGRFFVKHCKLALTDGRLFGKGYESFARLNFATSRALLTEVLGRISAGLEQHRSGR